MNRKRWMLWNSLERWDAKRQNHSRRHQRVRQANVRVEPLEQRQLLAADFTLELLHFSDQEAGTAAIQDAPRLSAVLNSLRAQDLGNDGLPDQTLTLSSGDAFIPGLFFSASEAAFGSPGIADIQIQNELGVQAIAFGNHEFDFGTNTLAGLIDGSATGDFTSLVGSSLEGLDFTGADFPYLSTNLDVSTDANLADLEVAGGQAPQRNAITSSTVIQMPTRGDAMATGENGFTVTPIFTVTETIPATTGSLNASTTGDYTPPGILDGLGAYDLNATTVRVFATHELTDGDGYAYQLANGTSLTGARISYFDIDKTTKQITDAGLAYDTVYNPDGSMLDDIADLAENRAGFTRFCSAVLIEPEQFGPGNGITDRIFFTGEETGGDGTGVSGGQWALDTTTGDLWSVPAMGRGAWENITEIDTGTTTHVGFILMDDTSPFDADNDGIREAAPMYLYVGEKNSGSGNFLDRNGLENGKLFVWVANDLSILDPSTFNGGINNVPQMGTWVELNNAQDLSQATQDGSSGFDAFGYPTQVNLWIQAEAAGAFGFSRPEDVATNPGDGSTFVFASTGRSSDFGGADRIGTLYIAQVEFADIDAPTATVTILYDGDQDPAQSLRSPDNLEWADDGLIYVQEDRAIGGIFGLGAVNPYDASIVAIDPADGSVTRVAEINQDATRGAVDENVAATGRKDVGNWESSGIIDVSSLFGETPGSLFLFDVQAHSLDDQGRFSQVTGTPAERLVDGDLKEGGQLAFLSRGADLGTTAEMIGIVGATTPTLASISSPGDVTISPSPFGANPTEAQLDALASEIQSEVDLLLASHPDMDKVILLAHMQQINIELALASRLQNVDIIVGGGSNTRWFDADDRVRDGDSNQGEYPHFVTNAGGTTTAVVNTDGSYKYVGRLVIGFDAAGNIDPTTYDETVSGAFATDAQGVADLAAVNLVDPEIQAIVDAIGSEIVATESNVFGVSSVFLNGNRSGIDTPSDTDGVRTQETNLGNLTADANLAEAQKTDNSVVVSIKNGGGIRSSIGQVIVPPGGSDAVRISNEAVIDRDGKLVKPEGGISQNDIQTSLAFNNGLTLMTLTTDELVSLLEHGVGAVPDVSGRFPQLAGLKLSYDPALPSGDRILNAAIFDPQGNLIAPLVRDGAVVNSDQTFRIVTLNFLAQPRFDESGAFIGGGDGYPFPNTNLDPAVGEVGDPAVIARINIQQLLQAGLQTGDAVFADDGSEQDALAEYLKEMFPDSDRAFANPDTGRNLDQRIQNLAYRADTVYPVRGTVVVTSQSDSGPGSFRNAIQIANENPGVDQISFGRRVNTVVLESAVEYTGFQDLRIEGKGVVLQASNEFVGTGVFVSSAAADLALSELTVDGDFDSGEAPANGIYIPIPAGAVGKVSVSLDRVTLQNNGLHGLHLADQLNDSDAGISLTIRRSAVINNGIGLIDFDGVRVDEGGNGDLKASIRDSQFDGNGGDGLELDERGDGDVIADVDRTSFDENGFFDQDFDPNNPPEGRDEQDLDDGFDIDEAGEGSIRVEITRSQAVNNFDEGFDFDEEDAGGIWMDFQRVLAAANSDEGIKAGEEDEGGIVARFDRVDLIGNGDDDKAVEASGGEGMDIGEEDEGNLFIRLIRVNARRNGSEGIKITEEGDGRLTADLDRVQSERNAETGVVIEESDEGAFYVFIDRLEASDNKGDGLELAESGEGLLLGQIRHSDLDDNAGFGLVAVQEDVGFGLIHLRNVESEDNDNGTADIEGVFLLGQLDD